MTSREAPFGVVPLENSQAGSVNETYDLLQHTSLLRVVGQVLVRVDHALLGVPGARLEDVRRARSHWQALAQCEEFLSSLRIEPVPVPVAVLASTAQAWTVTRVPTVASPAPMQMPPPIGAEFVEIVSVFSVTVPLEPAT